MLSTWIAHWSFSPSLVTPSTWMLFWVLFLKLPQDAMRIIFSVPHNKDNTTSVDQPWVPCVVKEACVSAAFSVILPYVWVTTDFSRFSVDVLKSRKIIVSTPSSLVLSSWLLGLGSLLLLSTGGCSNGLWSFRMDLLTSKIFASSFSCQRNRRLQIRYINVKNIWGTFDVIHTSLIFENFAFSSSIDARNLNFK